MATYQMSAEDSTIYESLDREDKALWRRIDGVQGIDKRLADLSHYYKYDIIVSYVADRYNHEQPMTAKQLEAWAKLAQTFGPDVYCSDNDIKRPKSRKDLVRIILDRARAEEEKAAKEAAE